MRNISPNNHEQKYLSELSTQIHSQTSGFDKVTLRLSDLLTEQFNQSLMHPYSLLQ